MPDTVLEDPHKKIRIVDFEDGTRSLTVSGRWDLALYSSVYKKYNCTNLWIYSNDGDESLEGALKSQLSNKLQLMGRFGNAEIIEGQGTFLESLNILNSQVAKLDLSKCNLESLVVSRSQIKSYEMLPMSLKDLILSGYDGIDLTSIERLSRLRLLDINGARKLTSFNGMSKMSSLVELKVWSAPRLENIVDIQHCEYIEKICFENCAKISHVDALASLKRLRYVALDKCGQIDSLKPLEKLNMLEELSFTGNTNISDGKLRFLLKNPLLKKVYLQDRRHYDIARKELSPGVWS